MGATTAISWTDHTFNPWWGCEKVSPGCDNCYAEAFAKRTGHNVWGSDTGYRFLSDKHWKEPLGWTGRVFCASMADVFDPHAALACERLRLWRLIETTPNLTWQLLTKRPEQIHRLVPPAWMDSWPHHVWIGTTVEDQTRADLRIHRLLKIPAPVRFLSCEPLLGPLDLAHTVCQASRDFDYGHGLSGTYVHADGCCRRRFPLHIQWVICGGESGPRHRPLNLDWARAIRDECALTDVAFFFKQVGGRTPTAGGDLLDGIQYHQFPEAVSA